MGKQHGQYKRNEELISWTRRQRRHLRREEILAYLCGKSPPPQPAPHRHRTSSSLSRTSGCRFTGSDRSSPRHSSPAEPYVDMQPFCEALAIQGVYALLTIYMYTYHRIIYESFVNYFFICFRFKWCYVKFWNPHRQWQQTSGYRFSGVKCRGYSWFCIR